MPDPSCAVLYPSGQLKLDNSAARYKEIRKSLYSSCALVKRDSSTKLRLFDKQATEQSYAWTGTDWKEHLKGEKKDEDNDCGNEHE
ncbi:hypothetical protein Y1Q_0000039 [Alligator mississippiensis]|uniref:Uncharacterized protein n=1 Tax=Alligator mississippiensis TaxID=8496 RepID=A0A151NTH1_ALLMI|nr:hypothetical protein Y1Q_0000039 [Alligator mississippiensis]